MIPLTLSQSFYAVADTLKRRAATEQGGLLNGADPTAVNVNDPLRLWIIQLAIIMCTAQLLSLLLRKLKQPKVIAEVIGGIVLGPTLMGRVPGFTEHIFPHDSIPFLSLVANIGLVLFLFLVGLEIETSSIKRNARTSLIISMGGMILPFSIGAGMSKLIYNNYVKPFAGDTPTPFTHFMLFTCVAYSITAFPVLCRILTELKLLDTTVGICVLSAGVGNDIVGWTLLALSVALVNATSGLTALYIVLVAIGWAIMVVFPFKKAFYYLALKTDSLSHNEPSILFMTVTLIFVFASAFFTDVIGVHAIFGGFLAGLAVPRENGLAIKMTEKIEDLVGIVFLPLYFTLSGLSTNLGLLNTGTIWGYTIAIIVTAWFGKFFGASAGARICGFGWRESGAIGELMSCKGLVELIVLNVGLQAGILSTLVFSMFVLEALVLTFMTTPLVVLLYPPHLRRRISKHANGTSKTLEGDGPAPGEKKHYPGPGMTVEDLSLDGAGRGKQKKNNELWGSVTVILDRLEHLPGLICVSELLRKSNAVASTSGDVGRTLGRSVAIDSQPEVHGEGSSKGNSPLAMVNALPISGDLSRTTTSAKDSESITAPPGFSRGQSSLTRGARTKGPLLNALRLMELSDRTSAVMKSILDSSSLLLADPLVNIFKTIHELRGGHVRGMMKVEPVEEWANVVEETVEEVRSSDREERELVVACWLGDITSKTSTGNANEGEAPTETGPNPFDYFFNRVQTPSAGAVQQLVPASRETTTHAHFVRSLFAKSSADVGLYVDNTSNTDACSSMSIGMGGHNTILFPFFGGPDDRAALDMVVGFCRDNRVRGVIVRISKGERDSEDSGDGIEKPPAAYTPGGMGTISSAYEGTIGGPIGGATNMTSAFPDTIYAAHTSATRLQSRTADEMSWEKYTSETSPDLAPSNIELTNLRTPSPLESFNNIARTVCSQTAQSGSGRPLIVVGRSRRLAVESHHVELAAMVKGGGHHLSGEFRKTVGDVASAIVIGGVRADMFVLQAGNGPPFAGMEV